MTTTTFASHLNNTSNNQFVKPVLAQHARL